MTDPAAVLSGRPESAIGPAWKLYAGELEALVLRLSTALEEIDALNLELDPHPSWDRLSHAAEVARRALSTDTEEPDA